MKIRAMYVFYFTLESKHWKFNAITGPNGSVLVGNVTDAIQSEQRQMPRSKGLPKVLFGNDPVRPARA